MKFRLSPLWGSGAAQAVVLCLLFPGLVLLPLPMAANPSGGVVVNGTIEIGDGLNGYLGISQSSHKGIINWDDFSIGAGELTEFMQPGADAATLNRVVSGNPSAIQGALRANGKIFVINPNGIMVGPGGSIDVAGLVLSTLDMSDAEFLAGGDMVFRGNSGAGVQNFGRINAIGGDVFLIGKTVENAGTITASGTVGLAAGEEVLITANPDAGGERVFVRPVGSGGSGTGVNNSGTIEGAAVELKAHGNLYALAINNSGSIRATGATRGGGGVYLRAPGGRVDNSGTIAATMPGGSGGRILIEGAVINAGGTLNADASTEQGQGGEVTLSGQNINVTGEVSADGGAGGTVTIGGAETETVWIGDGASVSAVGSTGAAGTVVVTGAEVGIDEASLAADGYTGGGEVSVGGGFQGGDARIANAMNTTVSAAATISANALGDGDGGRVVIWADGQTDYEGTVTAEARGIGDGGLVEISGADGLRVAGAVSTLAPLGRNGTLLLDPKNFTISAGSAASTMNSIGDSTLKGLLGANSVVISTFDPGTAEAGNISVLGQVRWNNPNSLTLLAENDIYVAQDIINTDSGDVNLVAGWDSTALPLSTLLGGSPAAPGATSGAIDMDLQIFDTDFYGNGGGSVYIGTSDAGLTGSDTGVAVASRAGQTNVVGHDVLVWAGALTGGINTGERKFSQIGYNRRDAATATSAAVTGRIRVQAKDDVDLDGNHFAVGGDSYVGWTGADRTGLASFAMIGHGGERDSTTDMTLTGEIIVEAGNDITADGGKTRESFAQIGHGGYDNVDSTPTAVVGGDITVRAGGDVRFTGGNGQISFAHLGHGGNSVHLGGYTTSEINVTAEGDVVFRGNDGAVASNGSGAFAQLGHGGYNMDVMGAVAEEQGDIHVTVGGKVEFVGGARGNDYALLGHGGNATDGDYSGGVTVNAGTGGVLVQGGGGSSAFAMIGHGGVSVSGQYSGGVSVSTLGGGVRVQGGTTTGTFANIGSGGYQALDGTGFTGSTTVDANGIGATDGVYLNAGNGNYAHAVIGHGVTRSSGGSVHPQVDLVGAVTVTAEAGGVELQASTPGYFSHAQIGHGGRDITGAKDGDVTVSVGEGDIRVSGGGSFTSSRYTHAQIGHGGYGNGVVGDSSGNIAVTASAGEIILTGGDSYGGYIMIGHGGFGAGATPSGNRHGDIAVTAEGDILLAGGTDSYTFVQIGHGGRDHDGDHGLAGESIRVIAETGNLELRGGGGTDSIALIGHGDNSASSGQRKGDILVDVAGEISLVRNPNLGWIGHRTATAGAMSDADVTIRASSADAETGVSGSGLFRISGDLDGAASRSLLGGDVSLIDLGDGGLWIDEEIRANTAHALNLLSFSDIFVGDDLINSGTGDINLVAGWAPGFNDLADLSAAVETAPFRGYLVNDVDMAGAIFENPGSYGAGGGSVHVGLDAGGGGSGAGVMVGSRHGATQVAGHDVNVWAAALATDSPYSHAQIGYNRQDSGEGTVPVPPSAPFEITGSVRVGAVNDVSLISNLFAVGADGYPGWGNSPTPGAGNEGYASFARIGHGARDLNRGSLLSGDILIEAGNDVTVTGGRSRENYAMIGHGGFDNKRVGIDVDNAGIGAAKISVDALGNVVLNAGSGSVAYAQIGHVGATHDLSSFTENEIEVTAGGDVTLRGGTGGGTASYSSFAMIGHGGDNSDFVGSPVGFAGDIAVNAGGALEMVAGDRNFNFVQIGHGGNGAEGNHRGKIEVVADGAAGVTLRSGSSSNVNSYAQIGHGGTGANGDHAGEICVVATTGGVTLDAYHAATGTGSRAYTQIGHGGYATDGSLDGDLTVVARGATGISLAGGAGVGRYAQIGHGGEATDGAQTGDLRVVAENGDLNLQGGAGTNAYPMTGHGDAAGTSTGVREGGIRLFADGAINGTDGTGAGSGVRLFHQTGGGLAEADYLGGDGFQIVGNGGIQVSDAALTGVNTMLNGNLGNGPISLAFANDIDLVVGAGNDFAVDTADGFYLLTGGDITMLSSYQNAGTGDVTLVAGWDGTGFSQTGSVSYAVSDPGPPEVLDFCMPTIAVGSAALGLDFNCASYGNNGALLTIGSDAQTSRVSVGSAGGANVFAGAGIRLRASDSDIDAATQLGFYGTGAAIDGLIDVKVKDQSLVMTSGAADGAFTQIGHGGTGADVAGGVSAGIHVSFCLPGDLTLAADPTGAGSYSQIGHGGVGLAGMFSGSVTVDGARDVTLTGGGVQAYSQIGHGGSSGTLGIDSSGDPTFPAPRSLSADGAIGIVNTTGAVSLRGGAGVENAYSQIGHGGVDIAGGGAIGDAVTVEAATGGITLQGGEGSTAYALIGSGGYQIASAIDGNVQVDATGADATDGIELFGGDGLHSYGTPRSGYSGAMIGNGGYLTSSTVGGDTTVTVENGGLLMEGGDGYYGNVTIGHTSLGTGAAMSGLVDVRVADGDITLEAGSVEWFSFAQIGHGGWDRRDHSGGVSVTADTGDIAVRSGNGGTFNHAKIGHGGYGNGSLQVNTGAVTVEATAGGVTLESRNGGNAFTQIGHGGLGKGGFMRGEYRDDVTVTAGMGIGLGAGGGTDAFAMIGHGGTNARGIFTGAVDIDAGAGGLLMAGGSGTRAFTQVGHGGYNEAGATGVYDISGVNVTVDAGKVEMDGGTGSYSYSLIGNGGAFLAGASTGNDVTVTTMGTTATDGVTMKAGAAESAFVMIGSGTRSITGATNPGNMDFSGTVRVTSAGGGISLEGASTRSFALIGNGGFEVDGVFSGDTIVTSNGGTVDDGISLRGGGGTYSSATIGSSNNNAIGSITSNTVVDIAGGGLSLEAGTGTLARAAIGLQSRAYQGDRTGTVNVTVDDGNVTLTAGNGTASQAQIGHGGYGVSGNGFMRGDVGLTVSNGTLSMKGGDGGYSSYTMVGNGGSNTRTGAISGNVSVDVSGTITMASGLGTSAFTQIGQGGDIQSGDLGIAGELVSVISRNGSLMMSAGGGLDAYTMIGRGGSDSVNSSVLGSVTAQASGDISLSGGGGSDAFALIGNGGQNVVGSFGVDDDVINVISQTGGVSLMSGDGTTSFAMIGMGGDAAVGDKRGDINVTTVDGVALSSLNGVGVGGFTKIGHGGHASDGTTLLDGDIRVAGSAADSAITLAGGDGGYHYVQIGHGGYSVSGTKTGNIEVSAGSGGVALAGGGQDGGNTHSFAQIGHGGTEGSSGAADGIIDVTTTNGGDIILHGGGMQHSHAQIGHGGRSSARDGLQSGAVTVVSDGRVEVKGSVNRVTGAPTVNAAETYAQIGHGGMFAETTYAGEIIVEAQTGVLLESGASNYNRAQIGHGGYAAGTNAGNDVEMVDADITVTTLSGGVVLDARQANNRAFAAAMIGNGGTGYYNATRAGAFRGDITVEGGTGNIELHSGNRAGSSAMIGNGGTGLSGDHSGMIHISADGDLLMGLRSSVTDNTFSRIGHGGLGSNTSGGALAMSGNLTGDICVHVGGLIDLDAGGGSNTNNYLQIGHGGSGVVGDFDGEIVVVARGSGGISLTGGTGTGAYAQIGHGGTDTNGQMTGHLRVIAETGDIDLAGGSGGGAYAMLGHGDGAKSSLGQRGGGMHLFAQGDITGSGGTGAAGDGNVYIFHQNNNGLQPADYLGGDGYQKVANGLIDLPGYSTDDESTIINGNIGLGAISIIDNSDTDYVIDGGDTLVTTSDDFQILTGGNITMLNSYQNAGTGAVTLVAGWNGEGVVTPGGVTFNNGDLCDPVISNPGIAVDFNDCDTFGNNGRTITVGSGAQTGRVSVGGAAGTNTFAAAGIELFASDDTTNGAGAGAQLGFYSDGTAATGAINLHVKDLGLTLNSGEAENAFAQVGHGGTFSDPAGGVNAAISITFCEPGHVTLNAEDPLTGIGGVGSYAQIGHGGNNWDGVKLGAIKIDGARNVTLNAGAGDAYAHIGHGGAQASGSYSTGEAGGTIEVINTTGKIGLYGGTGLNGTAQIGHGGVAMRGLMSGDVTVEAGTGGIEMIGNSATRTYAMIGNGGYNIDFQTDGNVTVNAKGTETTDGIVMSGGTGTYSGAFIGNGIYGNTGTVNGFTKVGVANGGIGMTGGNGNNSKVGIGHSNDGDSNTMNGYVEIAIAEGDLTMSGGNGTYTSATIGHEKNGGTATMDGYVDVDVSKGNIVLSGGNGQYANATIGHAGRGSISTSSGSIHVTAGEGDITLAGNNSVTGYFSHARIGHGGWESGNKTGAITVTADNGDILIQGGEGNTSSSRYNFAQIGHGGYGNGATQNIDETIMVTATNGSVSVRGGTSRASFGQIGHGGLGLTNFFLGSFAGDVTVKAGNAVSVEGGTQQSAHAQIGNGGAGTKGPLSGNVLVEAGSGGIDIRGGSSTNTHALIGTGGFDIDNDVSGSTIVRALGTNAATDGIRLKGGEGSQSEAHIGHLHTFGPGTASGAVAVSAVAGDIRVEAGDTGYFAHAQIGHGGRDSDGDKSGSVTVIADAGDIVLRAGGARGSDHYAHAQIGHGGYANGVVDRAYSDDVLVDAKAGSVTVTGGDATYDYAQIGHGGKSASTGMSVAFSGRVDVLAADDIVVQGGTADTAYAQIGHGGRRRSGTALSSVVGAVDASAIRVEAGRDVLVKSGTRSYAGAKIGHGHNQQNLSSFVENAITVEAGRNVELVSPQFPTYTGVSSAGTQIGHGGVTATVDDGASGYSGNIVLNAGGKLDLIAATNAITFNYALVGHTAYYNVRGNHSGDISVNTGTEAGLADYGINLVAGNRDDAAATASSYYSFASIGHRGHSNGAGGGDLSGDITVHAERGGLTIKGGMNASGADVRLHSAQIGHGGYNSDGLKSGLIEVCVEDDILLENGDTRDSPVIIGHGGFSHGGAIDGEIKVVSRSGGLELNSTIATQIRSNTQIGHGGPTTAGSLSGSIDVFASDYVTLRGGAVDATYAQIGHGGDATNSFLSGNMSLLTGGDLSLEGGGHADGYAMVGHGSSLPATSGDRDGSLHIGVAGATTLSDGASSVRLGHGSTSGNISNSEFVLATTTLDTSASALGVGGIVDAMAEGGEVSFAVLGGDLLVDGFGAHFDSGFDVSFVASGDVNFMTSVQNAGAGNVGVAAGWDSARGANPVTGEFDGSNGLTVDIDFNDCTVLDAMSFDFAAVLSDPTSYGNGQSVNVGDGNQSSGISVGSAGGTTNILAGGIVLQGSDTGNDGYAQIGYFGTGSDVSGDINLLGGSGGLSVLGGSQSGGFAQVGHGGSGAVNSNVVDGDITVTFTSTGGVTLGGGAGAGAYAQIGNGGADVGGTKSGAVTIDSGGALNLFGGNGDGAAAQVGHGGTGSSGLKDGDILVRATEATLSAGNSGAGAFTQIGHGGLDARFGANGFVTMILSGGGLALDGGDAENSFALVGNGGSGIPTAPFAGSVQVVATAGGVDLSGGDGGGSFAQIGNGGFEVSGSKTGSVLVIAEQSVNLTAGDGDGASAQIGMGGFNSPGNTLGGADEEVRVQSGADISLRASDAAEGGVAMIGNGGRNSDAVTITGDVFVTAEGDIDLTAGAADWAAAQIGNGGVASDGNLSGRIFASAGRDLNLTRGGGDNAYAKIGHGDHHFTPVASPALSVGAGDVLGGDIQATAGQNIRLTGGMIGHLDPALNQQGVGSGGDTLIAVSRDNPTLPGTGALIGDADSVLASDPSGELRLYLPGRNDNQLAGTFLNGVSYPGANPDPMNQQIDEFVIHQVDTDGVEVLTPGEHQNLENWELNLLGGTITADTANYRTDLGNYSLYYDTITVFEAGPPVVPGGAGGAGAGGGAGGGFPPTDPEVPVEEGEIDPGQVFTVTGPDGVPFELSFGPGETPGLFLRMPDGSMFYVIGRMTTTPLFFPVGGLLEDSLDDFLNLDAPEFLIENRAPKDPWGDSGEPDFQIAYLPDLRPGLSSFDLFGEGVIPFIDIVPMGVDDPAATDDDLRRLIERLQIELEEFGTYFNGPSGSLSAE